MNTFITPTNHSINSKYPNNVQKIQNQIGLVLAMVFHATSTLYTIIIKPLTSQETCGHQ